MLEIERKFLIKHIPIDLENYAKEEILQGYFKDSTNKTSRVRKTSIIKNQRKQTKYTFTQKRGKGLVRQEKERNITENEFKKHRTEVENHSLEKIRYFIPHNQHTIELNEYKGKLQGLWMAEIEFSSPEEAKQYIPPLWFGEEITNKKSASNDYLALYGMKSLIQETQGETTVIKENLKHFYNLEAKKYAQTRKKHRSDAQELAALIQEYPLQEINIIELGCGSGRFLEQLSTITDKKITYIGVDLSKELLKRAKKIPTPENIQTTFICDDMIHYLAHCDQESIDIIIGIASIQHLTNIKERFLCTKYIYRALKFEGTLIAINRSFSQRFIKTYRKVIFQALRKTFLSRGKKKRNDLYIPRKNENETFFRFYHIFTLPELRDIIVRSGFSLKKISYRDHQWQDTQDRKQAKNTFLIAKKSIWI